MWLVVSFAMLAGITAGYLISALMPRRGWPGPAADIVLGAVIGMLVGLGCAALVGSAASIVEDVWILFIALLSPYLVLLLIRAGVDRLVRPPHC